MRHTNFKVLKILFGVIDGGRTRACQGHILGFCQLNYNHH